jgi:pimeloyl-ACP methyl ester carboxylesterase
MGDSREWQPQLEALSDELRRVGRLAWPGGAERRREWAQGVAGRPHMVTLEAPERVNDEVRSFLTA